MKVQPQIIDENRDAFLQSWLDDRHRARTDLLWLCHNILGFKDVLMNAHGPIIDGVQKFNGVKEIVDKRTWKVARSEPVTPLWDLDGPRNHLLLYPRGHLKTSINTVAHSIQWILNYPDVRILLTTATEALARMVIGGIQQHFEVNERFRFLFPEFCPSQGKQIGNSEQFTVPNRTNAAFKEPTVAIITVTSAMAGPHYEVIKHSDVIDQNNARTAGGVELTRQHFQMCEPLLERNSSSKGVPGRGWRTIEGTIYNYADYHAESLERLQSTPEPSWQLTHRSCWVTPERKETIWPERFSVQDMVDTANTMGPELFANQYELNPIPEGTGLATMEELDQCFISRRIVNDLLPRLRLHVTIDLAGMDKNIEHGDYTVITLCGFDRFGRMYVIECHRGHFEAFEIVNVMFDLAHRYPKIFDFKIERDAHARGLRPTLEREQALRNKHLTLVFIPRDTHTSKQDRIKYTLRYWFANRTIRIADDLSCKVALRDEVLRFPKWKHDDILDTLVDQSQNQNESEPDIVPTPKLTQHVSYAQPQFRGYDFYGQPQWGDEPSPYTHFDPHTGV